MTRAMAVCVLVAAVYCAAGYNPDVDLTTPQIIRRHGYSVEAHTVQTEDGYLLTLHRITGSPNTSSSLECAHTPTQPVAPVFLQHGLLGSSADWILTGPGEALAYLLADQGYDVWLGNARGNTYSRGHVTLSTADSRYWNFSWHEMGYYDVPAALDHLIAVTGSSSVVYIGHSMGTTMFYAMAASRPEYNAKVRAMFSLAPVAYMSHVKSPIRLLAPFANDIQFLAHFLGEDEFLPQNKILHFFAKYGCELVATEKTICENFIFLLAGFDAPQFNMNLLPVVLSHTPAGTSAKTLVHYAQEIRSGQFQQFDHGTQGNWEAYNQSTPPAYDLTLISVPIELHYAKNDWLANTGDVEEFYWRIRNKLGNFLVKLPGFNHLDFLWGKNAKNLVYDPLISRIKALSPPPLLRDKIQLKSKFDGKQESSIKDKVQRVKKTLIEKQEASLLKDKIQTMRKKLDEKQESSLLKEKIQLVKKKLEEKKNSSFMDKFQLKTKPEEKKNQ